MAVVVLCIIGMPGSGKSTLASILARKSFSVFEMGDVVRNMMNKEGIEINNHTIREFALRIRKEQGSTAVSKYAAREIRGIKGDVVVSGVRSTSEINYFKKHIKGSIYIVRITAPMRTRYRRMKRRHRKDEPETYKDFLWREEKEKRYGVVAAEKHVNFTVINNGNMNALSRSAIKLVRTVRPHLSTKQTDAKQIL